VVLATFPRRAAYLGNAGCGVPSRQVARALGLRTLPWTRSWGKIFVGDWDLVLADLDEASRLAAENERAVLGDHRDGRLRPSRCTAAADAESAERIAIEMQASPLRSAFVHPRRHSTLAASVLCLRASR